MPKLLRSIVWEPVFQTGATEGDTRSRERRFRGGDRVSLAERSSGSSVTSPRTNPLAAPRATYRLQLHEGFTLHDAAGLTDYLAALGVSHVYLSPILQASEGSTHGYDVVDPNAARCGPRGRRRHAGALRSVRRGGPRRCPRHRAQPPRYLESREPVVAERAALGPESKWADVFDIDWDAAEGEEAAGGAARAGRDVARGARPGTDHARARGGVGDRAVLREDAPGPAETWPSCSKPQAEVDRRPRRRPTFAAAGRMRIGRPSGVVEKAIGEASRRRGGARSRDCARRGLNGGPRSAARSAALQAGAVAEGSRELNYRRFFDINEMVGTRVDRASVFDALHGRVLELMDRRRARAARRSPGRAA